VYIYVISLSLVPTYTVNEKFNAVSPSSVPGCEQVGLNGNVGCGRISMVALPLWQQQFYGCIDQVGGFRLPCCDVCWTFDKVTFWAFHSLHAAIWQCCGDGVVIGNHIGDGMEWAG